MDPSHAAAAAAAAATSSHARAVFSSLLRAGPASLDDNVGGSAEAGPRSSSSSSTADLHFDARIKDRRLQLVNPDRKRPRAAAGSVAGEKLRRREARVRAQVRDKPKGRDNGKGKSKGKEREVDEGAHGPRMMSRSQLRKRGLEGLDEETSYAALLPLAHLWQGYIQHFLGLVKRVGPGADVVVPNPQVLRVTSPASSSHSHSHSPGPAWTLPDGAIPAIQSQLCKADLVGARIRIAQARNPPLVGLSGIVARETEGVLVLAVGSGGEGGAQAHGGTPRNPGRKRRAGRRFKVVPKRNTTIVVRIELPPASQAQSHTQSQSQSHLEVPLNGNQMSSTMVTRATKKWKQRRTMDY